MKTAQIISLLFQTAALVLMVIALFSDKVATPPSLYSIVIILLWSAILSSSFIKK